VVLSASGSTSTTASHAHPTTATATTSSSTALTPPSSGATATTGSAPKKATNAGLSIYTVDSFTKEVRSSLTTHTTHTQAISPGGVLQAFAGNPAAVCLVPPSVELSEPTMKRIAREMNLSETAFVQPFPGVRSPPSKKISK